MRAESDRLGATRIDHYSAVTHQDSEQLNRFRGISSKDGIWHAGTILSEITLVGSLPTLMGADWAMSWSYRPLANRLRGWYAKIHADSVEDHWPQRTPVFVMHAAEEEMPHGELSDQDQASSTLWLCVPE